MPVLTTQLSANAVGLHGSLVVTLNASNPTDTTVRMLYCAPSVSAEIKVGGQWRSGTMIGGIVTPDSLVLTAGASTTVGMVYVHFTPPAFVTGQSETFSIAPGMYSVRACFIPVEPGAQVGSISRSICGNGVSFTLTP